MKRNIENTLLYPDCLVAMHCSTKKGDKTEGVWLAFLMEDFSMQFMHSCPGETEWNTISPNGQCIKCQISIPFKETEQFKFGVHQISAACLNTNKLYTFDEKLTARLPPYIPRSTDVILSKKLETNIENINYIYRKYRAGFSTISHFRRIDEDTRSVEHIDLLFLNTGGKNLVGNISSSCTRCKINSEAAKMRSFFILGAELLPIQV